MTHKNDVITLSLAFVSSTSRRRVGSVKFYNEIMSLLLWNKCFVTYIRICRESYVLSCFYKSQPLLALYLLGLNYVSML